MSVMMIHWQVSSLPTNKRQVEAIWRREDGLVWRNAWQTEALSCNIGMEFTGDRFSPMSYHDETFKMIEDGEHQVVIHHGTHETVNLTEEPSEQDIRAIDLANAHALFLESRDTAERAAKICANYGIPLDLQRTGLSLKALREELGECSREQYKSDVDRAATYLDADSWNYGRRYTFLQDEEVQRRIDGQRITHVSHLALASLGSLLRRGEGEISTATFDAWRASSSPSSCDIEEAAELFSAWMLGALERAADPSEEAEAIEVEPAEHLGAWRLSNVHAGNFHLVCAVDLWGTGVWEHYEKARGWVDGT